MQVHPPVTDSPFSIKVDRRGDVAVVCLKGSCTMDVAGKLGECVKGLASEEMRLLVLELSALDFIESTGLGNIVAGYLRIRRRNGEIRMVSPPPSIRHLLEITRLTQLFTIHRTVEEALC
jgi:anti-anti-sigma factor